MAQYRRKVTTVEAEQFFYDQLPIKGVRYPAKSEDGSTYNGDAYVVTAHNQIVYLSDGDWIIPEPDGFHYYPVKDDIFQATYEAVASADTSKEFEMLIGTKDGIFRFDANGKMLGRVEP